MPLETLKNISTFTKVENFLEKGNKILFLDLLGSWKKSGLGKKLLQTFLNEMEIKYPGIPMALQPLENDPFLIQFYKESGFIIHDNFVNSRLYMSCEDEDDSDSDVTVKRPIKKGLVNFGLRASGTGQHGQQGQEQHGHQGQHEQHEKHEHGRKGTKRKRDPGKIALTEKLPLEPLHFIHPPTSVIFYSFVDKSVLKYRGIKIKDCMIKF